MFPILRNIRHRLLEKSRFKSYLLYALGEIVLVVIGILIALQINNWNQRRQKEEVFHNSLEQLYNSIKLDTESLIFGIEYTQDQIDLINRLLLSPGIFTDEMLPLVLYYLDQDFDIEHHNTETGNLIASLEYDASDVQQREIAKELTSYSSFHSSGRNKTRLRLTSFLEAHNIPNPNPSFGFSSYDDFREVDTVFYKKEDLRKIKELAFSPEVRSLLLTLRAEKEYFVNVEYPTLLNDGLSILKLIKAYDPEVKLLYKDVGIIGTAFSTGWDKSVPMHLSNPELHIWEIDTFLNDGEVKFRTRDSWLTNWGGKTFPRGNTIYFGDNIPVKKGYYHIRINLQENTYEFIRKEK